MTYGMTQKKCFKLLAELFLIYIVESVYIELFEICADIIPGSSAYLEAGADIFISTLLTAAEAGVFACFIESLAGNDDTRFRDRMVLACMAVTAVMGITGYCIPLPYGYLFTMNTYAVPLLILSVRYFHGMKRLHYKAESYADAIRFRDMMMLTLAFAVLIIIENALYAFNTGAGLERTRQFFEKRITYTDDLFSILLGICAMTAAAKCMEEHMVESIELNVRQSLVNMNLKLEQAENELKSISNRFPESTADKKVSVMHMSNDSRQLEDFCRDFGITDREKEVLRLLLEGRTNREIADELIISIGTVKAHTHGIYSKIEVSRRGQLMNVFSTYGSTGLKGVDDKTESLKGSIHILRDTDGTDN